MTEQIITTNGILKKAPEGAYRKIAIRLNIHRIERDVDIIRICLKPCQVELIQNADDELLDDIDREIKLSFFVLFELLREFEPEVRDWVVGYIMNTGSMWSGLMPLNT